MDKFIRTGVIKQLDCGDSRVYVDEVTWNAADFEGKQLVAGACRYKCGTKFMHVWGKRNHNKLGMFAEGRGLVLE